MSTLQQMALRYPFKATAIVTLNLKSPRHESPFVHKIVDIIGALRWPRLPLGPAVPLLTIGPGTPTGTKTIYAGAQLAMQIDRVKQILSSLYLLGDYGSPGGNPTRASEGSLGPRGRCVSPGAGPANTSAADLTRGQSMSALRSLTFTTIPEIGANPTLNRRTNIIARLEEQKLLLKDPSYTRTVRTWVKKDGQLMPVDNRSASCLGGG